MALNWRDATTLELNDKLIPDPNAAHNKLDRLHNVRVAVEGAFLHIDPRRDSGSSQDLFMVPASAVHKVAYQVTEPAQTMIDVQVG
ncbi:hypothetical protein ACIOKA_37655 [Streptomyces anulatus]